MPRFSVIVATRNRPYQFVEALKSIISQTCASKEIIVVNDGSDEDAVSIYKTLIEQVGTDVTLYSLMKRPNGHGPSFVRNYGSSVSKGDYLCFLDDDDIWIDNKYLSRIESVTSKLKNKADIIISNQDAYLNNKKIECNVWLEGLIDILKSEGEVPYVDDLYRVNIDQLLKCGGLAHINTLIIKRNLYHTIDGMDESIRWEEDRDLFLRLLDKSECILYSPNVVAHHNVPDHKSKINTSTSTDEVRKRLYQLFLYDKACISSAHKNLRDYARKQKGYILKHLSVKFYRENNYNTAAFYAKQAMAVSPTLKWYLYLWYLLYKSIGSRRS